MLRKHSKYLDKFVQDRSREKKIGQNRKIGYSLGEAKLKSYADYDDLYNPAIFPHIISVFERNPTASLVYSEEILFNEQGVISSDSVKYDKYVHREKPAHVHGLIVYRSSVIESAPENLWNFTLVDWALSLWASLQGDIIRVPCVGRYWRQHPEQCSRNITAKDREEVISWFNDLVSLLA